MAEINIPAGPLDRIPYDAISPADDEDWAAVNRSVILQLLDDVPIGDHDRDIITWLSRWEPWTVATICSWILRVRNAATATTDSPTPAAATASAVLRRAADLLQGFGAVAAIRAAAGNEQLADAALRVLADYCGYGRLDPVDAVTRWQGLTAEHEIRRILPAAADHAEREGR